MRDHNLTEGIFIFDKGNGDWSYPLANAFSAVTLANWTNHNEKLSKELPGLDDDLTIWVGYKPLVSSPKD
jgi:hypothetical protein